MKSFFRTIALRRWEGTEGCRVPTGPRRDAFPYSGAAGPQPQHCVGTVGAPWGNGTWCGQLAELVSQLSFRCHELVDVDEGKQQRAAENVLLLALPLSHVVRSPPLWISVSSSVKWAVSLDKWFSFFE